MAEPPFQMPGHRWDPDKKRFFKILPGQMQSKSFDSDTASGSTTKRSRKGKQREVPPHEGNLFSETHFPAIDVRTSAQKLSNHKSAFQEVTVDPVTLRQHGRLPLHARQISEQPRIQAAYSHLALCTARRPFRAFPHSTEVVDLLSDPDAYSLVILGNGWITRSYPTHADFRVLCDTRYICGGQRPSFMWKSSDLLWYGCFDSEGQQSGIFVKMMSPRATGTQPSYLSEYSTSQFLKHDAPIRSCGQQAWAFAEVFDVPRNARPASNGSHTAQPRTRGGRGAVLYALSMGKKVKILTYHLPIAGLDPSLAASATISSASDVMALAFDLSGESLYCGTRCGLVMVWRRPTSSSAIEPPQHVMPVDAEGSVTNLAVVSPTELLIVRINGVVQLVDMATGETRQRYKGHVNSYQYKLAITIDKRSRMFALAGLDRRVRVWSIDSPLPLGTTATFLPPVYHPPQRFREGQSLVNQSLYDESEDEAFINAHPASNGDTGIRRGSTLSTVIFAQDPTVLRWHPRYVFEGIDPYEAEAIVQGQGHRSWPPKSQWNDLYVAVGPWVYQFRFP
ncbi:hypothetical protein PHSY_001774 [Pseudozyma hubeiensis SY62]|uniref:WD40 repeat-like protein n=1 Tax=Pseudozyma hubeiensis (strain SY62) TaxID=1305764 RepID=R9NZC4_PSEHS|nr:hypothetical protein PHSY_001774 [Pseudozyma hubeiensis SY62]GAC94203.1 hypothetical protein PHSY_001774 [Pseudozyma hubeiensis SY62]